MRRLAVVFLLVLSACTAEQELALTTPTTPPPSTTTIPATIPTTAAPVIVTTVAPTTTTTLAPFQGLAYEEVVRMDFPIQLVPWVPGFSMIATKNGQVWLYDGTNVSETAVLDISSQVRNQGEQGLLSIAVHPEDTNRIFAHYSAKDGDTVVSEFAFANGSIDPGSEQVLLRLNQPAGNHNGGMIQFGPEGMLYLGLGDGGGANDRYGNGQNRDTLLGGLVRIDVEGGVEPELFQYGLRNPWRFWIDGEMIYIADVGQNAFEEISVGPLDADVNYGWPITEGLHCFRPSSGCDTAGLTLPVVEVPHGEEGTCSITGGVVYRGPAIPELDGTYLFSDYCGGYLRGFRSGEVTDYTGDVGVIGLVASFGVDGFGEVYVMTTDRLLKIIPVRG
ncbi:MAG: PQQ-dependent sugar dehydrogenase [Actinomycetota bacterium]|nr:PQQ-dependent sugar dehydrogenase [Actinomycetota bacterium]